eukprot:4041649-Ditylum_brightwellii.AAC.1
MGQVGRESNSVYNKENQRIKYVNKESCHPASVFKAIPEGVFTRLGQLTSRTRENENVPITELYPAVSRPHFPAPTSWPP